MIAMSDKVVEAPSCAEYLLWTGSVVQHEWQVEMSVVLRYFSA